MIAQLIKPELHELIESKNWLALKEILQDVPEVDIAELLEELESDIALMVFRLLKKQKAAATFSYLSPNTGIALLNRFSSQQVREIMSAMTPDDRAAFMEELPGNLTQLVLNSLSPEDLEEVKKLLGYPEGTIGRLMTPKYVRVKKDWSVEYALEHIRKWGRTAETVNVIYVTDEEEHLIDDIRLNQFILALPTQLVSSLMDENFIALNANDDQEEAVKAFGKYDRVALPVVDSDGVLVGIVTIDDVFDVAEEEATEDMQLMAGMQSLDDDYSQTTVLEMVKKRIGWLVVLAIGQIMTVSALRSFESVIEGVVFLSLFIPMIISSGGNSGSQAATLIIRSLATEDLSPSDWLKVLGREVLSGILLGVLLGIIGFGIIVVWTHFNEYALNYELYMQILVVGLSLIGVVLFGNLAGSMLPFIISRLKLDPAVTSTPFVATLVDVTGILIYFTIAMSILKGISL